MARNYAFTIEVPEFDENAAYNHDRPISTLIRTQLLHLHTAENLLLPKEERTNTNINSLNTERQASEYIAKVTALLRRHGKRTAAEASKAKSTAGRKAAEVPHKKTSGRKTHKTKAAQKRASRK